MATAGDAREVARTRGGPLLGLVAIMALAELPDRAGAPPDRHLGGLTV